MSFRRRWNGCPDGVAIAEEGIHNVSWRACFRFPIAIPVIVTASMLWNNQFFSRFRDFHHRLLLLLCHQSRINTRVSAILAAFDNYSLGQH